MITILYRSGRYAGCIPNPRFMQVYRSVDTPTGSAPYRRVFTSACEKYVRCALVLPLLLLITGQLHAQVTLSGPQCVIPGTVYQYDIKGARNDSSVVKVDIKGGVLTNGISASTDRVKVSTVFVIWKDTAYRHIEVQTKRGNAKLLVQGTVALNGGEIKADHSVRTYGSALTDYTFQCSLPTGGSCNPNYTYQWQKSEDGFMWTDLANANEKDLLFSGKLATDSYFRRVTIETQSNTVSYSDVGLLTVPYN